MIAHFLCKLRNEHQEIFGTDIDSQRQKSEIKKIINIVTKIKVST